MSTKKLSVNGYAYLQIKEYKDWWISQYDIWRGRGVFEVVWGTGKKRWTVKHKWNKTGIY